MNSASPLHEAIILNRRKHRRKILPTSLSTLCLAAFVLLTSSAAHAELPKELARLERQLGIDIETSPDDFPVRTSYGLIKGKRPKSDALTPYAKLLSVEFSRYPKSLVQLAKLRRIVLCEDLYFAGQRRSAIPDWENDTLYLDVRRGSDRRGYHRRVMHHEFYHLVDYRDDGQVYADADWDALNRSGFRYGSGGRNAQTKSDTGTLTSKYPGFLNHYSTTGVEEDKAEVFSMLLTDPKHVAKRIASDQVLRAKVQHMKKLMRRHCKEVDEKFWTAKPKQSSK